MPAPEMFGPASFLLGQSIGAFTVFLPKFSEIRQGHPSTDPTLAADVRMGEVAACAITIGMGAIASSLTGSPIPAVVAGIACLILVTLYESVLNSNDPAVKQPTIRLVTPAEVNHA